MALLSITRPKKVMGVLGVTILTALTRALMHWRSERIKGTGSQCSEQEIVHYIQKDLLL